MEPIFCIRHDDCCAVFVATQNQLECMESCGCRYFTCLQGSQFLHPEIDCPHYNDHIQLEGLELNDRVLEDQTEPNHQKINDVL